MNIEVYLLKRRKELKNAYKLTGASNQYYRIQEVQLLLEWIRDNEDRRTRHLRPSEDGSASAPETH
jgi:hypothetical protein